MLVTLTTAIEANGRMYQAGEIVRVEDPEPLLKRGYARQINSEENRLVLQAYVDEAERVFGKSTGG